LHKADEIELRFAGAAAEKEQIIADAKREQAKIMEEALASREQILKQAKKDAAEQTAQMLEKARIQIEADTKSALADMRRQVAMLSVDIAEKIIRSKLSTTEEQKLLIDKMVSEASRTTDKTS
jgi:F-type H+-transporting ATPase subunit b